MTELDFAIKELMKNIENITRSIQCHYVSEDNYVSATSHLESKNLALTTLTKTLQELLDNKVTKIENEK